MTREADETWREIEQLVGEVSALASGDSSPEDFYRGLLTRTVQALAARGGAIWTRSADGRFRLLHQIQLGLTPFSADAADPLHTRLLDAVAGGTEALAIPPQSGSGEPGALDNPSDALLLLCPVLVESRAVSIVEIFQRPGASPAVQQGYIRLLVALCDLAADFHRRRELAQLRDWSTAAGQIEQFSQSVHRSLDLDATAYALANEGRRCAGCDRVSVLVRRRRAYVVNAISGIDTVDRRANLVRALEDLVTTALATQEPLWSEGETASLPPIVADALQTFVDESHARRIAVLPLRAPQTEEPTRTPSPGAVVLEWFELVADQAESRQRAEPVVRHGGLALHNALTHRSLPFFRLLQWLAGIGWLTRARQLPFTLLAAGVLVAASAALALIRAEFRIEARGQLQPETRRDVFAPNDGIVQQVHAVHAQAVAPGDLLVVLRKSELDRELTRVLGELQTARKQLESIQATRLQLERDRDATRENAEELTAREEELKKRLESFEKQHAILVVEQAELNVRSPIQGQVQTWEVTESLDARPVKRGQILMTVVDPSGPWVLELRVPDKHVGYVLAAREKLRPDLDVTFLLATHPSTTYRGTIRQVAMAAETDEQNQATVLVTVRIDRSRLPLLRPGATVVAKIDCGRRSLGFVWFHDLIEAVQTRLLF